MTFAYLNSRTDFLFGLGIEENCLSKNVGDFDEFVLYFFLKVIEIKINSILDLFVHAGLDFGGDVGELIVPPAPLVSFDFPHFFTT